MSTLIALLAWALIRAVDSCSLGETAFLWFYMGL